MRTVKDAELTKLKSEQSYAMQDLCNIIHVARASGTYSPQGTQTRTMVSGVACGIDFTGGRILDKGQVLLVDYDVRLRLLATETVLVSDEIQLVEKGSYVITGTFRPASQPVVNSTVQIVPLKRVT